MHKDNFTLFMFSYCFHEVHFRSRNSRPPRSPRPSGKSLQELLSCAAIAQGTQFFSRLSIKRRQRVAKRKTVRVGVGVRGEGSRGNLSLCAAYLEVLHMLSVYTGRAAARVELLQRWQLLPVEWAFGEK